MEKNELLKLELTPREMQWMYNAMKKVAYVDSFTAKENAEILLVVDEKMEKAWGKFTERLQKEQEDKN